MTVKESVLKVLEEHKGQYLSGQELAGQLDVSRNAIWKAVNALKKEGYEIASVSNKGYALSAQTDILSKEGISCYVNVPALFVYDEIDSTNEEAKRKALEHAPHGTLVVANHQTAGKGRRGRAFYSPSDTGIYMSILLRLDLPFSQSVLITTAASVAVCRAIETVCGISCGIKWVNDVYIHGQKIAGILTEAITDVESGGIDSMIVGIGVNVSTQTFPEEVGNVAASLYDGTQTQSVRNALAAEIYREMMDLSAQLPDKGFLEEYRKRSIVIGASIRYTKRNEWLTGKAVDIDADGGLVVESDTEGRITLSSGEISIRLT